MRLYEVTLLSTRSYPNETTLSVVAPYIDAALNKAVRYFEQTYKKSYNQKPETQIKRIELTDDEVVL